MSILDKIFIWSLRIVVFSLLAKALFWISVAILAVLTAE